MFQQQVYFINMILMITDAVCIAVANWLAYLLVYGHWPNLSETGGEWFMISVLIVVLLNNVVLGRMRLYSDQRPDSYWLLGWTILKAILIDYITLIMIFFVIIQQKYPRELAIYSISLSYCLLVLERFSVSFYIDRTSKDSFKARHLLIVGEKDRAKLVEEALSKQLSWGHQVVGNLEVGKKNGDPNGKINKLPSLLKEEEIDEVVFAMDADPSIRLGKYIDICRKMGITTRIVPALWDPKKMPIRVEECQGIPFITVHANNFSVSGILYKRILDIIGGLIGTFIFVLIYPFVGIAIKLDSPGPVLFKQKRVGQNGRTFMLLKFRSMYVDAEERKKELMHKNTMNGPMFKLEDDPRITRVGRFLRKTSIDEIPQFWNVLKGEMSLVGTRPPTPDEVKSYYLWHHRRISAKPGITGLWQISGRNKIRDFNKVVELDCQYLDNWRFMDDIKIILKTIVVVLKRKGAF